MLNAKFRYIQLCRSLRTYGVSFFAVKVCVCIRVLHNFAFLTLSKLMCVQWKDYYTSNGEVNLIHFHFVQEKTPGRNKLRPVLLGVSRDGVHRLDKTSKTLLQRWPLSTVKSYASTPSSFCLVSVRREDSLLECCLLYVQ